MTEIERLILEVESRGLAAVNRELNTTHKRADMATSGFSKLKLAGAAAGAAIAASITAAAYKLTDATKTYQNFDAMLKVATGSAEKGAQAFSAIQDFAAKTPYSLNEATSAFLRLVNLGLTPSERALESFGNTASGTLGKTLIDMVEAVADAVSGSGYERLKEFGISASKAGDQITFTFQGVSKTVKNTASEIEGYLTSIGENKFGGLMAEQMKGLNGAISNLGDAWDQLWVTIAKQGPDAFITQAFRAAGEAVQELSAQIASGEMAANLQAFLKQWEQTADGIVGALGATNQFVLQSVGLWDNAGEAASESFLEFFGRIPARVKGAVVAMISYVVSFGEKAAIIAKDLWESFKLRFEQIVAVAKEAGIAMSAALQGTGSNYTFGAGVASINAITVKNVEARQKQTTAELAAVDAKHTAIAELAAKEYEQELTQYADALTAADKLRADYDAKVDARAAKGGDRLAEFKVGNDGSPASGGKDAAKAADKLEKEMQAAFEKRVELLEEGLAGEDLVFDVHYESRKQKILDNTATTEAEKQQLVLSLLSQSLVTEEENIRRSYDARAEFILSSTQTTEETKNALLLQLTKQREAAIAQVEQETANKRLDQASTFFGNLASIGSTFGKKGFKIAQAAAIAQATIDTYKAATGAYSSLAPIPYIGPALGIAAAAAAVAAGAANIARIKSQTYSGAYEHGGMIPAGKYGLVGEAGPEYVSGPAVVTSAATSRAKRGSGEGSVRTVTVHNNGQPVEATTKLNGDELIIMLQPYLAKNKEEVKRELTTEVQKGGGGFSRAMETTYGVRR